MLNEEDSEIPLRHRLLKDGSKRFCLPAVKPRGGLVEQDHFESSSQHRGQFDQALLSDREQPNLKVTEVINTGEGECFFSGTRDTLRGGARLEHLCDRVPTSHCSFTTQLDVLTDSQRIEEFGPLKCASQPSSRPMRRAEAGQVLVSQKDLTRDGGPIHSTR